MKNRNKNCFTVMTTNNLLNIFPEFINNSSAENF